MCLKSNMVMFLFHPFAFISHEFHFFFWLNQSVGRLMNRLEYIFRFKYVFVRFQISPLLRVYIHFECVCVHEHIIEVKKNNKIPCLYNDASIRRALLTM